MDATLTLVTFLGLLAITFGKPQDSGLAFPDEPDPDNDADDRQGFRPQQGNFRPQQGNFRPQQGNFQPQGNFQQQGNFQGRPNQGNFQTVPFDRPNQTPRQTQRPPQQTQRPPQQTTANDGSGQTTTRIPPRDPGNRIVYILPAGCNCPFTYQYNPVCGTDGQTYGNMGVMQCARQCGSQVDVYLMGACGRNNG